MVVSMNSEVVSCSECGLMHPRTAPGECPVAMAADSKVAGREKEITEIVKLVISKLTKSNDYLNKINKIKKVLMEEM